MSAGRSADTPLGERKEKILTAVIDAYIETGEPVGSKVLAEALEHAVSSATIRNEMAELSSLGYLAQPHTSAGRVPTAKAFRLYIDRLMKRRDISAEDAHNIDGALTCAAGDPDRLFDEASQALAEITGCAAVTTTPSGQEAVIRRIEVLRVSPRAVALLLVTGSGLLRTRVCRFDRPVPIEMLERLSAALSARFSGCAMSEIGLPDIQSLVAALGGDGLVCAPAVAAFHHLVQESSEAEILLNGQVNLLRHPDYDPARARDLLGFLDRPEMLSAMLASLPRGLRVVLGSESRQPALDGSSIIVTKYATGGRPDGSIGIIGPVRMNYAVAIPRLEYFARSIGKILDELLGPGEPPPGPSERTK